MLQQEQRRRVRPLEVIEQDDQPLRLGGGHKRIRDALEQGEAVFDRRWRIRATRPCRQEAEQLVEHRDVAAPDSEPVVPQHLLPQPERRGALHARCSPPDDRHQARRGEAFELFEKPGLPDASFALEQHHRGRPGERIAEGVDQRRQLIGAADEPRCRARRLGLDHGATLEGHVSAVRAQPA